MPDRRRRALTALLLLSPVPTIAVILAVVVAPGSLGRVFWMAGKAILYGGPLLWHVFVDRERPSLSPLRRGGLWTGGLLGLLVSLLILGAFVAIGERWIDGEKIREVADTYGFRSLFGFLVISAWIVFGNSLLEEYVYRWFIFTRCRTLLPSPAAVALSAAIFTVHHTVLLAGYGMSAPIVALASAGVFLGGIIWSWCYDRYGSIWPGYLSHAIVDVAILAIGWRLISG